MSDNPRPPILLAEGEDISVFKTVAAAASYAEAIDVDDGVYKAWDAQGRLLTLSTAPPHGVATSRLVHIRVATPSRSEPDILRNLLASVLSRFAGVHVADLPLPETLRAFIAWAGYTR